MPNETRIGCMLPATPGAAVFSLGVLMASKTLVPLNWTNGPAVLDASLALAGVNVIFTAESFLEKAAVPLSALAMSRIVLAEDFRKRLTLADLVAAKRLVGQAARSDTRRLG